MSILCIGQAVYDITFPMEEKIVENQKYRISQRHECMGGPAANAAYLLGLWGSDVSLIARIGKDLFGNEILHTLETVGIDSSTIFREEKQPTSVSCVIVNQKNSNRTILNTPLNEASFPVSWPQNKPAVLLLDGHEASAARQALHRYPEATSIIDAGTFKPHLVEIIEKVDYLVCSEDFAFQYSGKRINLEDSLQIKEIFNDLSKLKAEHIVITLGERGCLYQEDRIIRHFAAFSVEAVDTTGAGDIFHGAFAFGIENNYSLPATISLASAASALAVQSIGGQTSVPALDQVQQFLTKKAR